MPLTDNEKLDALKFMSQTHRGEFNERRKYEWKIIFAILAFYIFSVLAICKEDFKIIQILEKHHGLVVFFIWFVTVLYFTIAVITSVFVWGIHVANAVNKEIAENAEKEMQNLGMPKVVSEKTGAFLGPYARVFQAFVVFIFAGTATLIVVIRLYCALFPIQ